MSLDFGDANMRRLPMYLLFDVSASMIGTKIVEINNGLRLIHEELMGDPRGANTIFITVINFADTAYQWPLAPITTFTPPHLIAGGGTALGAALKLLNNSLDSDIISNQPGRKGDYKPLVFMILGSNPTDHWQSEAQRLTSRTTNRPISTIGIAAGQDVNIEVIKQVCKVVLTMQNVTPEQLRAFLDWVSSSITTSSMATNKVRGNDIPVNPAQPPAGIHIIT